MTQTTCAPPHHHTCIRSCSQGGEGRWHPCACVDWARANQPGSFRPCWCWCMARWPQRSTADVSDLAQLPQGHLTRSTGAAPMSIAVRQWHSAWGCRRERHQEGAVLVAASCEQSHSQPTCWRADITCLPGHRDRGGGASEQHRCGILIACDPDVCCMVMAGYGRARHCAQARRTPHSHTTDIPYSKKWLVPHRRPGTPDYSYNQCMGCDICTVIPGISRVPSALHRHQYPSRFQFRHPAPFPTPPLHLPPPHSAQLHPGPAGAWARARYPAGTFPPHSAPHIAAHSPHYRLQSSLRINGCALMTPSFPHTLVAPKVAPTPPRRGACPCLPVPHTAHLPCCVSLGCTRAYSHSHSHPACVLHTRS